jgi:hypothetical protein
LKVKQFLQLEREEKIYSGLKSWALIMCPITFAVAHNLHTCANDVSESSLPEGEKQLG